MRNCIAYNGYGNCLRYRVDIEYQCENEDSHQYRDTQSSSRLDSNIEDCNPNLYCGSIDKKLYCYDRLLYPTICGPKNCDKPIGTCD